MPNTEMIMPKMGESVAEATIIKWLKKKATPLKRMKAYWK
jgi:hypothetical protein